MFPIGGKYPIPVLSFANGIVRKCEEMVISRWKGIRPNRVYFVKICFVFFQMSEKGTLGLGMGWRLAEVGAGEGEGQGGGPDLGA